MEELDKVTAIFRAKYAEWKASTSAMTTGYEYESSYANMLQDVGQEVFGQSTGKVPKSKNRKKNFTRDSDK